MAAKKPEVEITSEQWHMALDSNMYPHIFGHAWLGYDTVSVNTARRCQLPQFKMTGIESGDGNNYWTLSLRPDPNGYPHICDHAKLVSGTADIARRWLVTVGIVSPAHCVQ